MTLNELYELTLHHCSRPFDFQGRLQRRAYWMTILGLCILQILSILVSFIGPVSPLSAIVLIYTNIIMLNVSIRRLRDVGRSGWWMLCVFVPLLNLVLPWFFMFGAKQDSSYNTFGESYR